MATVATVKKLHKEPLLQFLLIGASLFGVYGWLNPAAGADAAHQVRIDDREVQWLALAWARQWQRQPTRQELGGLVSEYLKEELLAREARALGLDEDDPIVRRRLAQKLEFLVRDTARPAEPTEEELRRFYAENAQRFVDGARVSMAQIYFSGERRLDPAADTAVALAQLARGDAAPEPRRFGDPLPLEADLHDVDEQTVASLFGREFARAVFALEPGSWHGPIESGYGLHLVRVSAKQPARQRALGEVRGRVLEGWREQRRKESEERYFAGLVKKYDVIVEDALKPLVGPLPAAGWSQEG